MIGAIAGDIIGSVYSYYNIKTTVFPLFTNEATFTDNTVLSVAIADALLSESSFSDKLKEYYSQYSDLGYSEEFMKWAESTELLPSYNSWGSGSAMRVSPVAYGRDSIEEVLEQAKLTAEITHNHPEGIKGAQAIAASVFMARTKKSKQEIKDFVQEKFQYDLNRTLNSIRPEYDLDLTCQGTCPVSLIAFFESTDFEDAIRKAVSVGGNSSTIANMTGAIAQPFYDELPEHIFGQVFDKLDYKLIGVVETFCDKFLS